MEEGEIVPGRTEAEFRPREGSGKPDGERVVRVLKSKDNLEANSVVEVKPEALEEARVSGEPLDRIGESGTDGLPAEEVRMTDDQLAKIHNFAKEEMAKTLDPSHDFDHVDRVRNKALKIARILKVDGEIDLNLLQAICLLHDLTFTKYEPNLKNFFLEGKHIEKIGSEVLEDFDIDGSEKDIMMEAFLHHTHWFIFRGLFNVTMDGTIYTQILHDADKIDIFSEERWESLLASRDKYLFYKLSWPAIALFVRLGRNNPGMFLNFPKVAKDFRKN